MERAAGRPKEIKLRAIPPPFDALQWVPSVRFKAHAKRFWNTYIVPRAAIGELHPDAIPALVMLAILFDTIAKDVLSTEDDVRADPQLIRIWYQMAGDAGMTSTGADRAYTLRAASDAARPKPADTQTATLLRLASSQRSRPR